MAEEQTPKKAPKKQAAPKKSSASRQSSATESEEQVQVAGWLKAISSFIDKLTNDRPTQIIAGIVIVVCVAGYFIYSSMTGAPKGTWRYVVCKTAIERSVEYPSSVDILAAGEKTKSASIYYSKRNSFGDERLHFIVCNYDKDRNGSVFIRNVMLDDKPMPSDYVKSVSDAMKYIIGSDFTAELPGPYNPKIEKAKDRNPVPLDPVFDKQR